MPSAKAANAEIDDLFGRLKRQSDPDAATRIAERIAQQWSRSGSDTVDLLLGWAQEAELRDRREVALDLLDRAIALSPGYAEAWSRRAVLHFDMNRYDKSLADIACAIALEPRHFIAWTGIAAIYREMEMKQQALDAYLQVLSIFPANRQAQQAAGELAEEIADREL